VARAQAEALAAVRICNQEEDTRMLWTVVGLVVLWGLGLLTSHTMGGLIHVLFVAAVVMVVVRIIQVRRVR